MNEQQEERFSTADFAAGPQQDDRLKPKDQRTGEAGDRSRQSTALFPADQSESFQTRWKGIQSGFVDEPRHAIEQADQLIAEVMKALAASFADERSNLEQQWDRGGDVSTEDLRLGLQRYRSFFDRLLSI